MTDPQQQQPNMHGQFGGPSPQQPYGGRPQPGMYGPAPQQPYGTAPQQVPPHAGQQMYGQQPYPQAPGAPYGGQYPPPPRNGGSKTGLILGGALALVVVVILGVVAVSMLSDGGGLGGGSSSDPRDVAEKWVDGGNNNTDLLCKSDRTKLDSLKKQTTITATSLPKVDAKTTLKSVDVLSGSDEGTFTVDIAVKVGSQSKTQSITYDLVKEDGDWKVCGILDATVK